MKSRFKTRLLWYVGFLLSVASLVLSKSAVSRFAWHSSYRPDFGVVASARI